ncbi:hypothetical protein Q1695_006565 [Nippostrongylus brasiliensis]|nr:hypothetical protein Q1695_006565 [Nippostrongylus brasiliensis]
MSRSSRVAIDLFFDVISPYSWIGFEALMRYKQVWPIDVCLRPFYLAAVIKATKNPGAPLMVPEKKSYMDLDLRRNADYWNIPISLPENFKELVFSKSSTSALRLLLAIQEQQPSLVEGTARAMFSRLFTTDHKGIFSEDDLRQVLKASKVEDEGALLHLASSDGVKSKLRTNTDEALSQGCFGAPWMHVRSEGRVEPFFGSDRLPLIGHLIGHQYEGPLNHLATSTPV